MEGIHKSLSDMKNIDRIGLSPLANKEFRTDWTILISHWLQEFQSKLYIFETALSRIDQTPILVYDITTITVHYKSHFIALLQKKKILKPINTEVFVAFLYSWKVPSRETPEPQRFPRGGPPGIQSCRTCQHDDIKILPWQRKLNNVRENKSSALFEVS